LQESVSNRPIIRLEQCKAVVCPSKEEIARLADVLNSAQKVTILGGAGCAGTHPQLIEVAGLLQAPIVHAMRGKEFIEYDNPYDVEMTGLLGFSSGYYAMMNCDLLLMLGTDFPYQQFYPLHAYIIQVDIRGEQIGRRTKVDLGLVGDVHATLKALKPLLNQKSDKLHLWA
jgi:thiamine pyrophosphate-dependent acetolactate synthase large subunit-like protein